MFWIEILMFLILVHIYFIVIKTFRINPIENAKKWIKDIKNSFMEGFKRGE